MPRVVLQAGRGEPELTEPGNHRAMGGLLVKRKGQNAARFDVPVPARIRHNGRCAERAFGCVQCCVKLNLGGAVWACGDPRFFHLGVWQIGVQGRLKIQLADRGRAI